MPVHTQGDIVMANPSVYLSVRLSVCHTLVLYRNTCIYCQTLCAVWYGHDCFLSVTDLQNSNGNTGGVIVIVISSDALNTRGGWEKFAIFDKKLPFISETIRDRPVVTMEHEYEVIGSRSINVGSNDLE